MTKHDEQHTAQYSTSAWLYAVSLVAVVAVMAGVLVWRRSSVHEPGAVVVFLVAGVLTQYSRSHSTRETSISLTGLLMVVSTAVSGPLAAIAVGVVPAVLVDISKKSVLPRLFNPAMSGLAGGVGALCYIWCGGQLPIGLQTRGFDLIIHVLVQLVIANFAMMTTNFVVLSVMLRLTSSEPFFYTFWRMLPATVVVYGEYGFLAFIIVVLWAPVGLGITSLLVAAIPLLAAQWDMSQIANLRTSQTRTVSTLREMIEVHQPGSRARGQRIAETAIGVAEAIHVPAGQMQDLEHAALLSDLARVVPEQAHGRGAFDGDEADYDDQGNGAAAVASVTFLEGAGDALTSQYEKWDGSGPGQLRGEDIPLVARVVAVANAYWSFRDRWDNPDRAMVTVERLSGTAFDPQCVTALHDVHSRTRSKATSGDREESA